MSDEICPLCGGNIEEIIGCDFAQCDTCGFTIRSDGSYDYGEVEMEIEEMEK